MTPKGTGERQEPQTVKGVANEPRITEVEFRTDEAQLLGLWMVTRLLGEIRGVEQRVDQAELLTKAQILLTAFVLGLEPLGADQTSSGSPRAGLGQVVRSDA
jgi:hypothetical protein